MGVLGTLANAASKSAKGMDASLNKMEKRPDGSADAEMTRLIAATIRNRVPEAENILLTGDIAGDQLTALGEALKASGELDGKNILVSAVSCSLRQRSLRLPKWMSLSLQQTALFLLTLRSAHRRQSSRASARRSSAASCTHNHQYIKTRDGFRATPRFCMYQSFSLLR